MGNLKLIFAEFNFADVIKNQNVRNLVATKIYNLIGFIFAEIIFAVKIIKSTDKNS